ncbi:MAG: D-alanine--D-alanine ligase [Rikenellaceae bacterium]|nr:D-alanine--D-alanine ligase [Rikenellaceae bacterium]
MKKLNIALLAGGNSSEREVSLQSAAQVADSLDREKYNVYMIDVQGTSWTYRDVIGEQYLVDKNDFSLVLPSGKIALDYALVMIHGTPGEDGRTQGYLEMMEIPFSSSGVVSTVLTFDKLACKRAVQFAGLTVAKEVMIRKGEKVDPDKLAAELGLPLFIKPNASGSSCGVTKITSSRQIPAAVEAALAESDAVMAEQYIEGREMGCGIVVTREKEYLLPVTEIIPKKEFFDYEAKYTPGMSEEITPAEIEPDILAELNRMTLTAYRACGCRGIVRIDFIVNPEGVPYFIEINSIPGMSAGSIVPKQAASAGIPLGELFDIVIGDTYFERK